MATFSHLDQHDQAQMVDIITKKTTARQAVVEGKVSLSPAAAAALSPGQINEITSTARVVGHLSAKQTSGILPFCHPIGIDAIEVRISWQQPFFQLTTSVKTQGKTGCEMEALLACQMAACQIYDMIKAADPLASLGPFHLKSKSGGKSTIDRSSQ